MDFNEYQNAALRTANTAAYQNNLDELENGALGLCGEGGEVADLVKKAKYQGHSLDNVHIAKELGDCMWYIALAAHAAGYDLQQIAQMNVDKLLARYPDGFDAEKSRNRKAGDI